MQRLRALSEEECYLRCYGWRGQEDTVKVMTAEVVVEPGVPSVTAERIRMLLEQRLDERQPEAA